jgi:hypothetical protein
MLKSQNFSGGDTPGHRFKRGGDGWEGLGLGREGIGVWPTQKLSRGAPYASAYIMSSQLVLRPKKKWCGSRYMSLKS